MRPGFIDQIEAAFAAGQHALLTLNTEDRFFDAEADIGPANLNYFLAGHFSRQGYRVAQYAPSLGLRELVPSEGASKSIGADAPSAEPLAAINRLRALLRSRTERWIVLIMHAERLMPSAAGGTSTGSPSSYAEMLHTLALDDDIALAGGRMILVTFTAQPDALIARSRGVRTLTVGLPDESQREAFIRRIESCHTFDDCPFGRRADDLTVEGLRRSTAGMPLFAIEAAYRMAKHREEPVNLAQIRLAKAETLRSMARDLIDVSEPETGFQSVAGLQAVKGFFDQVLQQIRAGRPDVPQAVLFQGVPGCGKSHLVRALAAELQWPLLELRNVRNPYVGQSEMNLEHVIRLVEQLQPAVLFFDEIDQSFGQRSAGSSSDGGTSERLLARLFTWLGALHLRGRILFVGATNRPDLLDPALKDRFGVFIPFLKPGPEELEALVPLVLERFERRLGKLDAKAAAGLLAPIAPTGRGVQEILVEAGRQADREKDLPGSPICREHLQRAVVNHLPHEDDAEIRFISLTALRLCSLQSLLPWNNSGGLRHHAAIPMEFRQNGVVGPDGRLDLEKLDSALETVRMDRLRRSHGR